MQKQVQMMRYIGGSILLNDEYAFVVESTSKTTLVLITCPAFLLNKTTLTNSLF